MLHQNGSALSFNIRVAYRDLSTVRVLDWVTGEGHISYLLKETGFDVVSCDIASSDDDSSFGQETPILKEKSINVITLNDPWILFQRWGI